MHTWLTSKKYHSILCLSDQHHPYEHPDLIPFLKDLNSKYKFDLVANMGDECFDGDAQVLTPDGWMTFRDLKEDSLVMQYIEDGTGAFVKPLRHIRKLYSGKMIERKKGNYYSYTTANHDLVAKHPKTKELVKIKACDQTRYQYYIPRALIADGQGIPLSEMQIRLVVAISADFTLRKTGDLLGGFKKQRKKDRIKWILDSLGIPYKENSELSRAGYTSFFINRKFAPDYVSKEFRHTWLSEMSLKQKMAMLDELVYWDGYDDPTRDRQIFCSSLPRNIEFVQTLAHLCGYEASTRLVKSKYGDSYQVAILRGKTGTRLKAQYREKEVTELPVYCVSVPSGMLLVRQQGKITISGNCDNHAISYHEKEPGLPNYLTELERAIEHMQPLYKMFPEMELLDSNHGSLVYRKGKTAGLPKYVFKSPNEILKAPKGWRWNNDLIVDTLCGLVYFKHGITPVAGKFSKDNSMNAVQGHYHSNFQITYWGNPRGLYWDMHVGCVVNDRSLAMAYNKLTSKRPVIGVGVIIGGKPILEPMVLDKKNRWIGKLKGE